MVETPQYKESKMSEEVAGTEEVGSPLSEGQEETSSVEEEQQGISTQEKVVEGEEESSGEPEVTLESLAAAVHRISSKLGRVGKNLINENVQNQHPQTQFQQAFSSPQPAVPPLQMHNQQPALQQGNFSKTALVDALGEEGARANDEMVTQRVTAGVQQALAPYTGVLSQVMQAVQMSEVAQNNLNQLTSAFGDVSFVDVAAIMRADDIKEDHVKLFEKNPGMVPFDSVAPYFRAVLNARQKGSDKTAKILNNAAKNSKPVLSKKTGGQTISVLKQLEGKSQDEIAVILKRNPALKKQVLQEEEQRRAS